MRRRVLLAAVPALFAPAILRANEAPQAKRLSLRHVNTGARFNGIWHNGTAPDPVAMVELSGILADSARVLPLPFAPATLEILWRVASQTRLGPELTIHSGYRTPEINRAVNGAGDSQHLRAAALDVEVPTGRVPAVAEAALRLAAGGVGVYARRQFIHLDSGPVRHWRDDGVERAGPFRGTLRLDLGVQPGRLRAEDLTEAGRRLGLDRPVPLGNRVVLPFRL